MAKLKWDQHGERFFETGVDHGVLYLPDSESGAYDTAHPWNGLTSVNETPSGAEPNPQYADNIKYLNLYSREEFGATIEAFTYPEAFGVCDGSAMPVAGVFLSQQRRSAFGLSYRTLIGNDVDGDRHAYKLHLVWNAMAAPSEKQYSTVNESPEATPLSWELTTTPVPVEGFEPSAHMTLDSRSVDPTLLASFEDILYGTDTLEARLPSPDEVIDHFGVVTP